jgi:FAD/FMN-containing dehydrogenase
MAELRGLIFTEERFLSDPDEAATYLADKGYAEKILAVVKPRTVEEIQGLITLANRSGLLSIHRCRSDSSPSAKASSSTFPP